MLCNLFKQWSNSVNDSLSSLSCNNFIDKKAKWLLLEAVVFAFSVGIPIFIYQYSKPVFLQMTANFELID